jgi:hypothetical protein
MNSLLKFCVLVHLAVFFAAITWYLPSGSMASVLDQVMEAFEFIFSPLPFQNAYMLSDPAAEALARQLIVTFMVTALPSYIIGYVLIAVSR